MLKSLFPTNIGIYRNDNHLLDKPKILSLVNIDGGGEKNEMSDLLNHYGQESKNKGLDLKGLEHLKEWVCSCVKDYIQTGMGLNVESNIIPINSWLNVCGPGGKQFPHSHSNSLCCVTYYVNFIPNLHSNLFFAKTQHEPHNPYLEFNPNEYYKVREEINIEEGMLVVWPGHMIHGYNPCMVGNRVSLSMNFMPEVVMGSTYGFRVSPIE